MLCAQIQLLGRVMQILGVLQCCLSRAICGGQWQVRRSSDWVYPAWNHSYSGVAAIYWSGIWSGIWFGVGFGVDGAALIGEIPNPPVQCLTRGLTGSADPIEPYTTPQPRRRTVSVSLYLSRE